MPRLQYHALTSEWLFRVASRSCRAAHHRGDACWRREEIKGRKGIRVLFRRILNVSDLSILHEE